jgi:uncharacterized damage-inducible protein DinB
MNTPPVKSERDGLLAFLDHQRQAVRNACFGVSEEQARHTPTPSSLSLGGLVKHLAWGERVWLARIEQQPVAADDDPASAMSEYLDTFRLGEDETLADVLTDYQAAAAETDRSVSAVDDLNRAVPLPAAPWHPDPDGCTVRWVLLHLIEETARHAGHADILREALDGGLSGPLMAAAEGWPDEGFVRPWQPPA